VQEVIKNVPKTVFQEVVHEVPKIEIQVQERIVEVPHVQVVERTVEVPKVQVQEVVKHVKKPVVEVRENIVDVPCVQVRERVVELPEVHVQEVTRHVPKVVEVQEIVKNVQKVGYEPSVTSRAPTVPSSPAPSTLQFRAPQGASQCCASTPLAARQLQADFNCVSTAQTLPAHTQPQMPAMPVLAGHSASIPTMQFPNNLQQLSALPTVGAGVSLEAPQFRLPIDVPVETATYRAPPENPALTKQPPRMR